MDRESIQPLRGNTADNTNRRIERLRKSRARDDSYGAKWGIRTGAALQAVHP